MNSEDQREIVKRVPLHQTHPNMFLALRDFAIFEFALGLNFFLYTPAFSPFGISKYLVAVIFLSMGVILATALVARRNLRAVRLIGFVSFVVHFIWGCANTEQSLNGPASLQLPMYAVITALLLRRWASEPPVNPVTANGNGNGKTKHES